MSWLLWLALSCSHAQALTPKQILLVGDLATLQSEDLPKQLNEKLTQAGLSYEVQGIDHQTKLGFLPANRDRLEGFDVVVFIITEHEILNSYYQMIYQSGALDGEVVPVDENVSKAFTLSEFTAIWWSAFLSHDNPAQRAKAVLDTAFFDLLPMQNWLRPQVLFAFLPVEIEPTLPENWNYLTNNFFRFLVPTVVVRPDFVRFYADRTFGAKALQIESVDPEELFHQLVPQLINKNKNKTYE